MPCKLWGTPLPGQIRKLPIPNPLGANQDFQSLRRFHGSGRYGPRFSEIKSLEEDNFLQLAGFRVYKCPVFGARETGTTFRRLRIEETEAMNCTNRLPHWDEQQPKHLSDIRRVGRGLTGHGVVLLAAWSGSAVVNQHGDLASHSAICRTELSHPRNLGKHDRARIFFVLP